MFLKRFLKNLICSNCEIDFKNLYGINCKRPRLSKTILKSKQVGGLAWLKIHAKYYNIDSIAPA